MAVEPRRGCGFRKVGGLYLVAPALGEVCHRLPFLLVTCPTCGAGFKPARGWTWVDAIELFGGPAFRDVCRPDKPTFDAGHCPRCVVCSPTRIGSGERTSSDRVRATLEDTPDARGRAGLLWIGERFYPTPEHFALESSTLGVSRRIGAVPRGFVLGETWVLLAHRRACVAELEPGAEPVTAAGIFSVFRPTALEKIVRASDDTPEARADAARRGITLVPVPDSDPDHQGTVYDDDNGGGAADAPELDL